MLKPFILLPVYNADHALQAKLLLREEVIQMRELSLDNSQVSLTESKFRGPHTLVCIDRSSIYI
jgi:hypothetical protein